jgi:acid-sensing ion channel, other
MNQKTGKFSKLISTNFTHQTKEFFGNSTLHGVRYIAENGRKFSEKFMWFCCVAIGAVAAFVIIDSLWEKFQTNPTITGNAWLNSIQIYWTIIGSNDAGLDTEFEYNQMEFPTVTVCPVDFLNQGNETLFSYGDDNSDDYSQHIEILMSSAIHDEYEKDNGQTTLRQVVFNLAISCEEFLYDCTFRGFKISCCHHFQPVYNERGFCYAFNARYVGAASNEWVEST